MAGNGDCEIDDNRKACFTYVMTKSQLKKQFGSVSAIAKALNITKQAVSDWPEKVPFTSQARLSILFPDLVRSFVRDDGVIEFELIETQSIPLPATKKKKKAA